MAIVSVIEDYEGLRCETAVAVEGAAGTLVRQWDVTFDAADAAALRPVLALSAVGIPNYWDVLDVSLPYWYVAKKDAHLSGTGPLHFKVVVTYEYYDNPLAVPAKVSWRRLLVTEPIDRDRQGRAILTSSDEPYDPPITEEFSDRILRIECNMAGFDEVYYDEYSNATNSDLWFPAAINPGGSILGFAAHTVKCLGITGDPDRVGNIVFSHVVAEFQIRDDEVYDAAEPPALLGWRRRLLDQGFRTKSGVGAEGEPIYAAILDGDGNPVTQPVRLDGDGGVLADGAPDVYRVFETKKQKTFASLPF